MTENDAVVVRVEGEHAWVDFQANCSSCSSTGCGLGSGKSRATQRIRNDIGARVGDQVLLSVPEGAVLRAVLFCYLLPVVLALAGGASGLAVAGEGWAIVGALLGLAGGWASLRVFGRREPELRMTLKSAVIQLHRNPQT
jgi:sigma-E factor negative regulatory protein RseC